jgi:hypothetical protein
MASPSLVIFATMTSAVATTPSGLINYIEPFRRHDIIVIGKIVLNIASFGCHHRRHRFDRIASSKVWRG